MALVACEECRREISDQATACPTCGAPVHKRSRRPGLSGSAMFFIVLAALLVLRLVWPENEAPPAAAAAPPPSNPWKVIGRQGQGALFIVMDKSVGGDMSTYAKATATECPRDWCQAMFWVEGTPAAAALPLSDEQIRSKVALYRRNKATGLSRFSWRCDVFPESDSSNCFTPE